MSISVSTTKNVMIIIFGLQKLVASWTLGLSLSSSLLNENLC